MKYYLVGIKGTGMSALALYLKDLGHDVVGSDVEEYFFTEEKLKVKEIPVYIYNKENINSNYIYIIGLSINKTNEEFMRILDLDIEYYYYNNFISEFIDKKIIAVSGAHGKTTTCHLIKEISDVSAIIGCGDGVGNDSDYLVLEACEYKNHFHSYEPELLLIQSLDYDHPDFFKNKRQLIESYQIMANKSNILLINGDDRDSKRIIHPKKFTYGTNWDNDYVIKIITTKEDGYTFLLKGDSMCRLLKCHLLGIHNLYNYVGAYLACVLCNIDIKQYKRVSYPERRMTSYILGNTILIDDYAHHPTEIENLYNTIKLTYPDYMINVIFQSHTYSRTLKFKRQFKIVLKKFDNVYMMDVFSSMREQIDQNLQKKLDNYFKKFKKYRNDILSLINGNKKEIWLFLGAGTTNILINEIKKNNKNLMKI